MKASLYRLHRFPSEIISHCVWLYFRFALSYRGVEEILQVRGVIMTYETIRERCLKFGQTYANELRRRRPRPGDKWHLDEIFIRMNGKDHYLWRAVDQDGLFSRLAPFPLTADVYHGPALRVVLGLAQHFVRHRRGVAFAEGNVLEEVSERIAFAPAEVDVWYFPRLVTQMQQEGGKRTC